MSLLILPHLRDNLVLYLEQIWNETTRRKAQKSWRQQSFQAKIFSRENHVNIKMNGDVDMIDASSNSDTVAILDAGAQYGKVIKCDLAVIRYDFYWLVCSMPIDDQKTKRRANLPSSSNRPVFGGKRREVFNISARFFKSFFGSENKMI